MVLVEQIKLTELSDLLHRPWFGGSIHPTLGYQALGSDRYSSPDCPGATGAQVPQVKSGNNRLRPGLDVVDAEAAAAFVEAALRPLPYQPAPSRALICKARYFE
jgi:hypothetical protein